MSTSLAERFPWIEWREPIRVTVSDNPGGPVHRWCCRICIARKGMRGEDLEAVGYIERGSCVEHIRHEHPEEET
jgi:hypothetical protein